MSAAAPAPRAAGPGWLFGPAPDLLLGCGLAYTAVFVALSVAGPSVRELAPFAALTLGMLIASVPHYGATLMRVYARREDRQRYRAFALWASLAIVGLFVAGLHDETARSWIHTTYLTWSPWHYTAQNFGIAMMLLGRGGVALSPRQRKVLWWHFASSFALVFLAAHGDPAPVSYAPEVDRPENVHFVSLGIPHGLRNAGFVLVGLGYFATALSAVRTLTRPGSRRAALPALCLLGTQALWFSLPALSRATGVLQELEPFSREFAAYTFLWIAYGHAIQYLWVTAYFAKRRDTTRSHRRSYAEALLAGSAIWGLPALLFMPAALGPLAYDGGLFLMIAACVNIHHFVLDGAVWKLRDRRVGGILVRDESGTQPTGERRRPWLRRGLLAAGGACAVLSAYGNWTLHYDALPALRNRQLGRAQQALDRLEAIGRESPKLLVRLGRIQLQLGKRPAARATFLRSLAIQPTAAAWLALGGMHVDAGRHRDAALAFDQVLVHEPESVPALLRSASLWLYLGDLERAGERIERALALAPDDADVRDAAERVAAAGRRDS